jgi:hypothetical protein
MSALTRRRSSLGALGLAAGCASLSGAAFVAHALGWLRMPFFLTFFSLPAALVLVALQVWSRAMAHRWLGQRLWAGCWIGLVATLLYDGVRAALVASHLYSTNPLRIIVAFGVLITGRPESDAAAVVAGWIYHFWNGINFATMYVLAAGRGRWPYAVAWAMFLEGVTLAAYPGVFGVRRWDPGFVTMSLAGHLVYGLALGLLAERLELLPLPAGGLEEPPCGCD